MMRDLAAVRKYCRVTPQQEEILDGHQKPIILLEEAECCRQNGRRERIAEHPGAGKTEVPRPGALGGAG